MKAGNLSTAYQPDLTLAKLLKTNAAKYGSKKAALRVKGLGIWQETSWQEYYDRVREFSLGVLGLGLGEKAALAVIGHNRPSSLYAIVGTQVAGGIPVCIHHESTAAEIASFITRFKLKYILAEDQEQIDKILETPAAASLLGKIIYCNPRGMKGYADQRLISLDQLLSEGREFHAKEPNCFEQLVASGSDSDAALISISSGSSGEPRGALLSQKNILATAANLAGRAAMNENHEVVSFLPLSLVGELLLSLAAAILVGFTVNFPEKPETIMEDLREIGPQLLFAPPEIWAGIASSVQIRIMETTPFKKFMYRSFIPMGERLAEQILAGRPASFIARLMYGVAYIAVIRALRDRLGLSRVKTALTGGSPLGKDAFRFFHSIGVNLKQVYGLTEIAGAAAMHDDNNIKVESVGRPLPGVEVSISPDGEILLKGEGVFSGYYGDAEGGAAALENGWLHSGDAGRIDDDGHLIVTDRCDSIITLADGSRIAPQLIESSIRFSPYIREAVVTGRGESFLSALVCINGKIVGKWAGENKLSYSTYSDLASKPEVYDLIVKDLERVNRELPKECRLKRFTLLYKDLDPDDGEIARTGKVLRRVVEKRFSAVIEALYRGDESLQIDTAIELSDGKSARVQSTVFFRNLG